MAGEKRSRAEKMLSAALDCDPAERATFVERECGGDAELRREVESLLGWAAGGSLLGRAQVAGLAEEIEEDQPALRAGEKVGRYEVLKKIGAGGMGEVYLARDANLGRQVALKLLTRAAGLHRDRLRRFMQEAHTVSSLNHPNILTIHEAGQADTVHYIVTEYVEGETLRARLARAPIGIDEALKVAVQVADALAAAHQAKTVHRDIKPENIMLRRDGYVKVLDFGLAKLTESLLGPRVAESEAPTRHAVRTNSGVVIGTPEYMSPEQARGVAVDARTDVWSLGVVLYEMVEGLRPFEGPTYGDTIVSILEREPLPLGRHTAAIPAELERIVTKALAKDVDERYQTIKDMAIDLKWLKKRLEIETEHKRSVPLKTRGGRAATGEQNDVVSQREQGVPRTRQVSVAASTSSLEYAVTEIRRHKVGAALVSVLSIAALVGGGYGLFRLLGRNETKPTAPFQAMKITQLTGDGTATAAAISPDGKYVAYVLREEGRETVTVRQVATSSDLQVVPSAVETVCIGLTFSPDGDYLYYVTLKTSSGLGALTDFGVSGTLYRVPVLGGVSRRLLTGVGSPVTFSPDGARLAFVRADPDRDESALMLANADGSGERRLGTRPPPEFYISNGRYGSGPAWSPDGKVIACSVGRFARQHVVVVSAVDGSEKPLGSQSWQFVGRLAWLPDASALVLTARDQGLLSQLWELSYPAGEARRITNDLNSYADVNLDADAASLVSVQSAPKTLGLWVISSGEDPAHPKKIASAGAVELSWTPDGRLVYAASSGERMNLWMINQDGTEPKQLTASANSFDGRPSVSPDGRYIVFGSDRGGPRTRHVWRIDIDGSNPVQLTSGEGESWPTWSTDARWVVYSALISGKSSIWKIPTDGGNPVQLTATAGYPVTSVSPDGKLIAYTDRDEFLGSSVKIIVMPFDGGGPVKTFDLPPTFEHGVVRWTPDGHALSYVDRRDGVDNIWNQPLEGGAPRQITDFKSDEIGIFDWSRDGKLALWRGMEYRNVVLISNFR